jgi:hypothetical protein
LIKRLQDAVTAASAADQVTIRQVFARAGLDPLLDIRPQRWVERVDNREVWGPLGETVLPA